ncbi:MAG TPA: ATP-binding protein, partial [Tepidisphaeraceae bacterium]
MDIDDPANPLSPQQTHDIAAAGIAPDWQLLATEEALRCGEQRFRALAAASGGVFYQMSADWSEMQPLDGRGLVTSNDAPVRDWLQRNIPDTEHAAIRERIAYSIRHKSVFELEHRVYGPDRGVAWTYSRAVPVLDGAGQIVEWIGSATDITARKTAEEQLHRSREELEDRVRQRTHELAETNAALRSEREFLAAVLEHAVDGIVACDADGTLRLFNRASREFHGLPEQSLPPEQWAEHYDLYASDGKTRMSKEQVPLFRALTEGVVKNVEMVIAPRNQQPRVLMANGQAIRDGEGRMLGAVVVMHDLTAGKLAEAERERAIREEAARLEVEASAQQLRTSEERLRLALLIARMGTFEIDLRTDAVDVNDAGRDIYGWQADEALTFTKVQTHFHPDDRDAVVRQVGEAFRPDGPGEFEVEQRIVRTDGAIRWIKVRGRAMFDAVDGERQAVRCLGTYLDITDQKEAEEQREQMLANERNARSEAERAGRMKDEFLATLSHELRTPLNAILGWSQILASSNGLPSEIKDGLQTIERNARAQAQIIEDLLDMSRIISGKVRLDVQRVDLAELLREGVQTSKPSADAKGIGLTAVLDPLAGRVRGDPARLQQVMWNLLTNAVKFTPRGGRVQVLLERVNSHVEVSVIDSGEGIKPEFLPYVFDRFRQADASTTRRHGGLGLGLSIVKQLVELHGGSIRVKSAGEGLGSTFIVSLPLTVIHPESPADADRRHPKAGGAPLSLQPYFCAEITGVKVLVVDDEPDARALVKRLLEDCNAVVTTAASAAEALEKLQAERPDVLLSDVGMPTSDGYQLIRLVRALPEDR